MNKHFYLQNVNSGNGEYNIWQPIETVEHCGEMCARCLLVANEEYPIVSQEDAPYTALFSPVAIASFIQVA